VGWGQRQGLELSRPIVTNCLKNRYHIVKIILIIKTLFSYANSLIDMFRVEDTVPDITQHN